MTYRINNSGAVEVSESFKADPEAKVSNMFRFGVQNIANEEKVFVH